MCLLYRHQRLPALSVEVSTVAIWDFMFADAQVSAHRPLEVTRMAMHAACDREMTVALREYRSWVSYQSDKKNVCNRAAIAKGHGSGYTGGLKGLVAASHAANGEVSSNRLVFIVCNAHAHGNGQLDTFCVCW